MEKKDTLLERRIEEVLAQYLALVLHCDIRCECGAHLSGADNMVCSENCWGTTPRWEIEARLDSHFSSTRETAPEKFINPRDNLGTICMALAPYTEEIKYDVENRKLYITIEGRQREYSDEEVDFAVKTAERYDKIRARPVQIHNGRRYYESRQQGIISRIPCDTAFKLCHPVDYTGL